ncbi:hypothetical protein [Marinibactrum halimedae]|uniref:Uncharacterized protein n=1 Tax=Marinibactrum halimedae TaxID=1444977 RepID=A0AA37T7K4_9GAMM|nr:hypothetical protein [Marinibactrum halimedae]MCD9458450.1 hypothetical protein [Marinibactrum halimedae]GLS26147.1 hypothetical protein GCM10007877_18620 [Marinibactrum halimedae]
MKKISYVLLGAFIAGLVCNLLFWGIGQAALYFEIRLFEGEAESARNFLIFLFTLLVFILGGGLIGWKKAT